MNIAAYCRVSTDKEDQLNSLDAQKRFFAEYTQKTGDTLVRIYADEGISGTKTKNRKEFLRLLKDAEHGLFDTVVVKDISRFARNTVDLLQSIRKLKALGIETIFLTANMTNMGNSEFVLTIFGALAQEESANTSKRIKFGKKMNAERGRVPNIVYGYDKTIGDYFNLTIHEGEAETIRQIYQWYLHEGYGASKIAKILNEKGIRTKRDCNWSQNAVCRILTNELYTGKIINGKQEVSDFLTGTRADRDETDWMVTERPDLRIISDADFEAASNLMQERGKAFKVNKARQSNKYLFSTLIKCKDCGWSFRRTVRSYKNTYVRWVCSGHNGQGADSCPNRTTVDEDELIAALEGYFVNVLSAKKNIIKHVVSEFNRIYKAKDENVNYEKELRSKLSKLQKSRQKYMDMYTDDLISREELNRRIGGMREEIEKIENDLKLVELNINKGEQLESVIKKTFDSIESIADVRQLSNAQLKRIIQKIEVDKDGNVDIYLRLLGDLGLDETVLISDNRTNGEHHAAKHTALCGAHARYLPVFSGDRVPQRPHFF
ncbi:recombinase family protein [Christensenellaceae bacterium OttesenSCG-928-L17]|nr:recombinase family protein [Christensenellaceae bacterium OttesenSCG-928-L17]